MAQTPTTIPPELWERIRKRFDEAQLVELRGGNRLGTLPRRFNRAFGVGPGRILRRRLVLPER